MFLVVLFGAADLLLEFSLFFLCEVFEESLLEFTGIAVVILDDLGRQVVQDFLLQTTEQEREDLLVESFYCQRSSLLLLGGRFAETTGRNRLREPLQEDLLSSQEPGHQEIEQRPQFQDIILDWSSGKHQAVVARKTF